MECGYCGQTIKSNQGFCTNCGAILRQSSVQQSQEILTNILAEFESYLNSNGKSGIPSLKDEDPNVAFDIYRSLINKIIHEYRDHENYRMSGKFIASLTNDVLLKRAIVEMPLSESFDYIGVHHSRGRLSIFSSVGKYLGESMRGGEISVKGNAGDGVGKEMSEGVISITGNVEGSIGPNFHGGKIVVGGDVNGRISSYLSRGEIIIGGNLVIEREEDIADYMEGGEIIISGDLVNRTKKSITIGQRFYAGTVRIKGNLVGPIVIDKPVYDGQIIIEPE